MNPDIFHPKRSPEETDGHHEENDVNNASKEIYTPDQQPTPEVPQTETKPEKHLADPEQDRQKRSEPQTQQDNTLPQIQQTPQAPDTSAPISDEDSDTPAIADDVDVIEKTWVDKAKRIIDETKGDPYQQEARVEKLQRSYLKKRYGKEIKPSS